MLTPVEIQSKSFKSGGLGYDKKDVDNYMKEILRSYEDVYRENVELKDKVSVLNEGIQYYKTIEKTLQKALVLAEKTAEETKTAAAKEAKRIEKEATAKANIMLADARNELDALHQQTVALVQLYERYRAQFKSLAAAQVEMLDSDAFSLNVQKLDAFVSDPTQLDSLKPVKLPGKEKDSSYEVNEIVSDNSQDKSPVHLSDFSEENDFDFSDYNLDGQEEFDFVVLNEGE